MDNGRKHTSQQGEPTNAAATPTPVGGSGSCKELNDASCGGQTSEDTGVITEGEANEGIPVQDTSVSPLSPPGRDGSHKPRPDWRRFVWLDGDIEIIRPGQNSVSLNEHKVEDEDQ